MAKATPVAKVEPRPVEFVVYIGGAGSRTVHAWQWTQAGIASDRPRTVQWDASNGYRLPKTDLDFLTDDEFDRYIRNDGKFAVIGG